MDESVARKLLGTGTQHPDWHTAVKARRQAFRVLRAVTVVCFSALFFTALALVPAAAHVAEVVHKMGLTEAEYRVVQQLYAGWALFGIIIFAAIISTAWLSIILRHQPRALVPSLIALISLAGTQVIFWTLTFPVNRATVNWTMFPINWSELRTQWEYSHAMAAALNLIAFVSTIVAVLRRDAGVHGR